jgi:hypothetical protein
VRLFGTGLSECTVVRRIWHEILAAGFADVTRAGPRRVARFLGSDDDDLKAEVAAFVAEFLAGMAESPGTA